VRRIVTNDPRIADFVAKGCGCSPNHGNNASIGVEQDGELIAGVVYTDFNGKNITAAIHGIGATWLNREFLWLMFYYPFEQAGAVRITATIETFNEKSHNLVRRLGFMHEATLQKAGRFGDLHVYRMFRDDCKWLKVSHYELRKIRSPSRS